VAAFDVAVFIALPLAFGAVGAFLTVRVPTNPIGPLLLVSTTGLAILVGSQAAVPLLLDLGVDATLVSLIGLSPGLVFIPSILIVIVGVPLIFPTGLMLSRRWWAVVVATVIALIPVELTTLVSPLDLVGTIGLVNPLENPGLAAALEPLNTAAAIAAIPLFLAAGASLVIRYRRSDDVGRHQIRWLAAAITVAVVAFSISFNAPAEIRGIAESVGIIALMFIPLAIAVAVVRYRLYEIDRLISRGIAYALLTVVLLVAYAVVVIALQEFAGGWFGRGTVPIVVSTLLVASLFQPLRRRIQTAVDRRFDRARVDGAATAAAFSERLRDQIDIEAIAHDVAVTVDGSFRPTVTQLWLRRSGSDTTR
jgi:hypothetical protein